MLSTFEYDMSLVVVSVHSFRVVASRIMTSWPHRSLCTGVQADKLPDQDITGSN